MGGKRCYLGVVQWWTGSGSSPRYYHYQHRIGTRQASPSALGSIGPNDQALIRTASHAGQAGSSLPAWFRGSARPTGRTDR